MLSFGDLWSPNAIFPPNLKCSEKLLLFKLEILLIDGIYTYIQLRCVIFAVPSQILCILGSAAKAQVSDSKERETVIYYYCQEKLTCVSLSKCLIALFRTLNGESSQAPVLKVMHDSCIFLTIWNVHSLSLSSHLADDDCMYKWNACKGIRNLSTCIFSIGEPTMPLFYWEKSAMHWYWNASLLAHSDGGGWRD